ncbi:MAG: copper homeostasis protein CutC, partial [Bacteroidota bacterium]
GLPVTFHRAFDRCVEPVSALDSLMHHGVRRVLSSGGTSAASESVDRLCAYQVHCGEQLTVLAGGGVRSSNVNTLLRSGQLREVHTAAIVSQSQCEGHYRADQHELESLLAEIGSKEKGN